jgi:hypothetical protein
LSIKNGTNILSENQSIVVDTVAQLKTLEPKIGMKIETLGFHSKGDGGGASYVVEARGSQEVPAKDADIIVFASPNDNYIAKIVSNVANIR